MCRAKKFSALVNAILTQFQHIFQPFSYKNSAPNSALSAHSLHNFKTFLTTIQHVCQHIPYKVLKVNTSKIQHNSCIISALPKIFRKREIFSRKERKEILSDYKCELSILKVDGNIVVPDLYEDPYWLVPQLSCQTERTSRPTFWSQKL